MAKNVYFVICLTILFVASYKSIVNNFSIKNTEAKKGIIDIRHYDLSRDVVSLNGDWRFYWKEFLIQNRIPEKELSNLPPIIWEYE